MVRPLFKAGITVHRGSDAVDHQASRFGLRAYPLDPLHRSRVTPCSTVAIPQCGSC